MLGARLFSSLLLWGIILALVTLRYTNGVFLLIAIVGLAAQREFYLSQRSAGPNGFLKNGSFGGRASVCRDIFLCGVPLGWISRGIFRGGSTGSLGDSRSAHTAGVPPEGRGGY